MKLTPRTAAAGALTVAALTMALGTAHATTRTVAPARLHATVTAPHDEHDPKEDVELDENGRPDLGED
ncbi:MULTISPECIES: hypothetical protein [Streptomyces]|uniref:hypothetical protein n=1 Tax=Streptomyces arenae TaxID=29301 RepID=UPI00265826DD|nr:hypothetical protein [Streptomyces arenae]MCG7206481.1 hypothetical protein [Streptomyces arenae]